MKIFTLEAIMNLIQKKKKKKKEFPIKVLMHDNLVFVFKGKNVNKLNLHF